jgi:hypothetical protein
MRTNARPFQASKMSSPRTFSPQTLTELAFVQWEFATGTIDLSVNSESDLKPLKGR